MTTLTAEIDALSYLPEVRNLVSMVTKTPADELETSMNLVEAGLVDSMRILQIITDLERRFDIEISETEAEDFLSLKDICEGVARRKAA